MEEAERVVDQTLQMLNPAATIIAGALDSWLKNRSMVQKLSALLNEAAVKNKKLEEELNKQCKDVKEHNDQETKKLIETGLTVTEASELAKTNTDKYWMEKYGDSIAFVSIDNRDCMSFERNMAMQNLSFSMLPIHLNDGTSLYMAFGKDLEKIKNITQLYESRSCFMTPEVANEILSHKFVKRIEHLPYNEMMYAQEELAKNGVTSQAVHREDGYDLIIPERELQEHEHLLDSILCVGSFENSLPIQKNIDRINQMRLKPMQTIMDLQRGEYKIDITILDSAHPENYISLKKGGAIVYENQMITKELDLNAPDHMHELENTFASYVFPVQTKKDINSLSYDQLNAPYAAMSMLEQQRGRYREYLQYLDRERKIEMKMGVDVDNHPVLYTNDLESMDTFMNHENNADLFDNIAEADKYHILDNKDLLNMVTDDEVLTADVIKEAESGAAKITMSTEMYTPEISVDIEDAEREIEEDHLEFDDFLLSNKNKEEELDDLEQ